MTNGKRGLLLLQDLLRIEGLSGNEGQVARYIVSTLRAAGCPRAWITEDDANRKIGRGFSQGNLIVRIPGNADGPRLLFCAHMDTVPLTRGARPRRRGQRIVSDGKTGLGGDDRAGVACVLSTALDALRGKLEHPNLTFLFTVGEEVGLRGSKHVSPRLLGNPRLGFNFDGGSPLELEIGAVGATRWEARIKGRGAHAGVAPERGISSALIGAKAIHSLEESGLLGRIVKGKKRGTSNIGVLRGGEATNQVMDDLYVKGECRSHDPGFLEKITREVESCFNRAATNTHNSEGRHGSLLFSVSHDYPSFLLEKSSPVVTYARSVFQAMGLEPVLAVSNGGLDANFLNRKGIPSITLGTGNHAPHTTDEYVDLGEFRLACRIASALMRGVVP